VGNITDDIRENSMFVFDAGGNSKDITDAITGKSMIYVTRKKLNVSDYQWMGEFRKGDAACVYGEDWVYCRRTFEY
jgi:transposase